MPVNISNVISGSLCEKKGICPGDTLVSINGNEINDVLDYRFYADEQKLKIEYVNSAGRRKRVGVKGISSCDDLGLQFETYLMDKHRSCKNHCIFCFIDQLPRGMRDSLYFKDDDSRLSFLFGNYITLTNLSERDVERIIKMHISPLNASVHTMDPELRVAMMRNPHAGEALGLLRRFSDAGISINAQLVLCPGINDGKALANSLQKLGELSGVKSIAAVPVGLTKFREGLYPLRGYTKAEAADVIDLIDDFNAERVKAGKEKLAFPSDEFFQLAGRPVPEEEYYADFPQLDNGVGLLRLTENTFYEALEDSPADRVERKFAIAAGSAAFPLMQKLAGAFCEKYTGTSIEVYEIKNRFFGEAITVTGLITGKDLIAQLKEKGYEGGRLLLSSVMFRASDDPVFLDDVTIADVERELGTKVCFSENEENLFELFLRQHD